MLDHDTSFLGHEKYLACLGGLDSSCQKWNVFSFIILVSGGFPKISFFTLGNMSSLCELCVKYRLSNR